MKRDCRIKVRFSEINLSGLTREPEEDKTELLCNGEFEYDREKGELAIVESRTVTVEPREVVLERAARLRRVSGAFREYAHPTADEAGHYDQFQVR